MDDSLKPSWRFTAAGTGECRSLFPLFYGRPPADADDSEAVRSLEPGRLYLFEGNVIGPVSGAFSLSRAGRGLIVHNVDPRSMMQGDYMRLSFEVADQAFPAIRRQNADGHVVVAVDGQGVGHFRRLADARPLAPGEVALRYRIRGGEPNFATNAYFFEEGQAAAFAEAAYGEFRVGGDGEMILTGLRDDRLRPLGGQPPLAGAAEAR